MTQEQIQAAISQLMAQGYTQEQAIAAVQQHLQQQAALESIAQPAMTQQQVQAVHQTVAVEQTPVANAVQQNTGVQQTGTLNNLLSIAHAAGEGDDHSVVRAGFAPAQKGRCTVRLRGYIEVGVHKPSNPTHKNREMVHLIFEVNTPQHMITEDGVTKPREIVVRTPKAHSGNAGFPRLFNALNAAHDNRYHHIGEMLGQAWCAEIYHSQPDGNNRVWENFDNDKVWSFAPTSGQNMDGSPYNIQVPELYGTPMFFVFDNAKVTDPAAIKQLWDSIYIPGVRVSQSANGQETQTSKNYYQELIRASLTWNESKTKAALSTQCDPSTLEPIAPKARANTQAQPTQVPDAAASVQPVVPQMGGMAVPQMTPQVAPQVQHQEPAPQMNPAANQPQVSMPDPNVSGVAVQNQTVSAAQSEPQVVAPAPTFTPPPTLQEQVQAQPTVIAENTVPQVSQPLANTVANQTGGDIATDPNAFLAQFATK